MKYQNIAAVIYVISLMSLSTSIQALPKVANNLGGELDHTKNDVQLTLGSFNREEIVIGKITKEGIIDISLPKIDIKKLHENANMGTDSLVSMFELTGCKDESAFANTKTDEIFSHKFNPIQISVFGIAVGELLPVSDKETLANNHESNDPYNNEILKTGSHYYFYNIDKEIALKGNCEQNAKSGGYNVELLRTADIKFNKEWNFIKQTLVETQEYSNGDYHAQKPKKISYTKADINDPGVKWYLKRFEGATDERLKMVKKLNTSVALTESQFMKWKVPSKLDELALTSKKYGITVPRSKNKSNLHLVYANESQKKELNVYVLDSAENIEDLLMANSIYSMDKESGKDKKQKPYVAQYKKNSNTTQFIYKYKNRLVINAMGLNIQPDELWLHIQKLNIEKLLD